MGGAVLRLDLEIGDHDVVQRTDRLAKAQRLPQPAGERHAIAAQIRRQRHGHPGRIAANLAALAVRDVQLHAISFSLSPTGEREYKTLTRLPSRPTSKPGPRTFTEPAGDISGTNR